MKKQRIAMYLPLAVTLLAAAGFFLRRSLYAGALDEKNLLLTGTPAEAAVWVCTLTGAALTVLASRKGALPQKADFSASLSAALGQILAAWGILLTVLLSSGGSALAGLWKTAGILSAPLLMWAAFDRVRGGQPFFGTYGVCSIFFALHLISHYQSWCADPQLQNYVFAFGGMLAMMLYAYQLCACCVGMGNPGIMRTAGLMAGYFCLVAAADTHQLYLLLGCAAWGLTGSVPGEERDTPQSPPTEA